MNIDCSHNTVDSFYDYAIKLPPFDVANNPRGFPHRDGSCQAALMPALRYFASQCSSVIEFGCREGYSTAALLKGLALSKADGDKEMMSVDFCQWPSHEMLARITPGYPVKWMLYYRNIVDGLWQIPETDMLHVDDLHTFDQVKNELAIHGPRVKRFISFHDTFSQGTYSLDVPGAEGINRAILEFTEANGFVPVYQVDFNHGLWIFEKQ